MEGGGLQVFMELVYLLSLPEYLKQNVNLWPKSQILPHPVIHSYLLEKIINSCLGKHLQTITKLHDSWKLLNTRADVSFTKMCDCKWDLSCFAVSNTELKSAFGVKHNIHLLLCTTADDLLSSNTIQLSSNTIVIKNDVSYWLQIPQLSTQLSSII